MNKNKLLSLLLSTSVLLSASGCSSNNIKRTVDENNNVIYSGTIANIDLEKYFIIEIININNQTELYLTKNIYINGLSYGPSYDKYVNIGTDVTITDSFEKYQSDYGEVVNIIPFEQYIPLYSEIKDVYTAEEIIEIFECVKKDYSVLKKNKKIKTIELK